MWLRCFVQQKKKPVSEQGLLFYQQHCHSIKGEKTSIKHIWSYSRQVTSGNKDVTVRCGNWRHIFWGKGKQYYYGMSPVCGQHWRDGLETTEVVTQWEEHPETMGHIFLIYHGITVWKNGRTTGLDYSCEYLTQWNKPVGASLKGKYSLYLRAAKWTS